MCAIFGIYGHKEAAKLTYLGLYSLQHRGEEATGIVSFNGKKSCMIKGRGLVSEVYDEKTLASLKGHLAVGHNRYSTTGLSSSKNIQPFLVNHRKIPLAVSHNGNFTNTVRLYRELEKEGAIFQTSMDSEIIIHLIVKSKKKDIKEKVIDALSKIEGAYSLVLLIDDMIVAARDPYGFRPLCLGSLDGSFVVSSESCALDLIGAKYLREVDPGEVIFINKKGLNSQIAFSSPRRSFCIFEYIYFARPDSSVFGNAVYKIRENLGRALAKEAPLDVDLIMPIPDSGNHAALGVAKEARCQFEFGMIRNHYIGRTFIQPTQFVRDFRVKVKLNPIKSLLKDKKVAVIEDSIVRGTTSRARVRTLREAGADQVHMRVSCPPIKFPCFYGIDFPTCKELVASKYTVEKIREFIGLDSLYYLSKEGMLNAAVLPKGNFCTACFDGDYPVKPAKKFSKDILEK
ncbi:MAG: amidophosphoribosyltransferase [Candidatus Omnitrophica bacterium]|nr:amidophosphoribosyltransferase [Candidatus Omnitrophota bacterium]